ncbi:hypothetical protein K501DRAFT_271489 [Backusella circina FSU 941]|nr:hypothetical protein K501DRAFT_271489 [Backusella circina FSU 941]
MQNKSSRSSKHLATEIGFRIHTSFNRNQREDLDQSSRLYPFPNEVVRQIINLKTKVAGTTLEGKLTNIGVGREKSKASHRWRGDGGLTVYTFLGNIQGVCDGMLEFGCCSLPVDRTDFDRLYFVYKCMGHVSVS